MGLRKYIKYSLKKTSTAIRCFDTFSGVRLFISSITKPRQNTAVIVICFAKDGVKKAVCD